MFALCANTALAYGMAAGPALAVDLADQDFVARSPVINGQPAFAIVLAGTIRLDAHMVDQDIKGMRPSGSLGERRLDLSVFGRAITFRGLSYGFEYDIDEVVESGGRGRGQLYLANRFGRIDIGDTESATGFLDITGDRAMVGSGTWAREGDAHVNFGGVAGLNVVTLRDVGGTLRYTTPVYGGLTLAVSYTAESDFDKDGSDIDGSGPTTSEDIWSVAGRYISSYGNYTTVLYGGYERSNNGEKISARGNQEIISAGVLVQGMGAALSAGWGRQENELAPDAAIKDEMREWYDIGLSFSNGPWAVSAGGAYWTDEAVFLANVIDTSGAAVSASFQYALAPGLALMGGVTHYEIKNGDYVGFADAVLDPNGRADNSATTFTLSTQVSF